MIKKIFDESNNVLHIIHRPSDEERVDIVDYSQFIQVACMNQFKNQFFNPHYHIERNVLYDSVITQETLIVIRGQIEVSYFNQKNEFIESVILNSGDCTITLKGGHSCKSLSDDTLVYEVKNGPYVGRNLDKEYF